MINFTEKTDGVAILCGLDAAYVAKKHQQYETFLRTFYSEMIFVDDLNAVRCEADKFTIYFPDQNSQAHFDTVFQPHFGADFAVTLGDTIWVDIMNQGIDKGEAMRRLGKVLKIEESQMMAFGDTYNDVEMLQAVKYSYIVANAAPEMRQYAKYVTKSNDEYGVLKVLDEVLALQK